MKSCISTYSFERLYQDGGFTRFDAIDKTKEYGCQGVELVLDDKTPDGSTPMEYAKALYAHAKEQGLEVPIYTTGANFFVKEPEKELERLCRHIDIAAECKIPLLRHDVAWGYYEGYTGIKSYKKVIEAVAPFVRQAAEYARERGVKTCSENHRLSVTGQRENAGAVCGGRSSQLRISVRYGQFYSCG